MAFNGLPFRLLMKASAEMPVVCNPFASPLKKSPYTCNLHGLDTEREMYIRARQENSCIFSIRPMNHMLPIIDLSICQIDRSRPVNNSDFLGPPLQKPWLFPSLRQMPHTYLIFCSFQCHDDHSFLQFHYIFHHQNQNQSLHFILVPILASSIPSSESIQWPKSTLERRKMYIL